MPGVDNPYGQAHFFGDEAGEAPVYAFEVLVGVGVDELAGDVFVDEVFCEGALVAVMATTCVFEFMSEDAGSVGTSFGDGVVDPDGAALRVPVGVMVAGGAALADTYFF